MERQQRIDEARQSQPVAELERKASKAQRPGWFTQEDIDAAKARAKEWARRIGWE